MKFKFVMMLSLLTFTSFISTVNAEYKGVRGAYEFKTLQVDGYKIDCYSASDIEVSDLIGSKPLNFCTPTMVKKITGELKNAKADFGEFKLVQITKKKDNVVIPVFVDVAKKRIYIDQSIYSSELDKTPLKNIGKFKVAGKNKFCFDNKVEALTSHGMDFAGTIHCLSIDGASEPNSKYNRDFRAPDRIYSTILYEE